MKLFAPVLATGLALLAPFAHAEPADYIYTPEVEYGEREIDFKMGSANKSDSPREAAASIGFGYGVTPWWFTEFYVKYKQELNEGTKFDAFEWENKFQLTETGKYPVDLGFLIEIERPNDHDEGWEIKAGPLLQTEFGKWQLNGNMLFQRNYQAATPSPTRLLYQWQVKYRMSQLFEYGLQGMGDLGAWDNWAKQEDQIHLVGPAVFGKISVGPRQAIKYNAAVLFGNTKASADNTVRLQVEYEY